MSALWVRFRQPNLETITANVGHKGGLTSGFCQTFNQRPHLPRFQSRFVGEKACTLCADFVAKVRCRGLRTLISVVAPHGAARVCHDGAVEKRSGKAVYSFCLEEVVPDDHLVRGIAAVLDLSWVHSELAPYYPRIGRAAPAFALST
jgi:hypothetical protein